MFPTAITLKNYRSFATPTRLELRPVTLLFGENNVGKSALLRILPILGDSTGPAASGPLELESPAARGSSFQELLWKGIQDDEERDLLLSLTWGGSPKAETVDFALTWFDDWRRLVIRRFSIRDGEDNLRLTAEWRPSPQERSATELTYEIRASEASAPSSKLGFQGLVPRSWPTHLDPILKPAAKRLATMHNQAQWLMATRQLPDRIQPFPTAPRWRMKSDGSDTPQVLSGSQELLGEVSTWYEKHLRRKLHIQEVPPNRFRLMLQNLDKAALDTDLADNGEGTIQVLPVLTALALTHRQLQGGPGLLAIEEPESHLHPTLQRALAERICDVAAGNPSTRIVLETHSEQLLLGLQLQIVQGRLRPEDVLVYWVRQIEGGQSIADAVTFDDKARFQGAWPPGVFSSDTDLAREILTARRERPGL